MDQAEVPNQGMKSNASLAKEFDNFSSQCPNQLVPFADEAYLIANASPYQKTREVLYLEAEKSDDKKSADSEDEEVHHYVVL